MDMLSPGELPPGTFFWLNSAGVCVDDAGEHIGPFREAGNSACTGNITCHVICTPTLHQRT